MRQSVNTVSSRFFRHEGGATAVIYALALLPILLLIGFSIDYRRTVTAKAHLQTALDSAVLSAALEYSKNNTLSDAQRLGRATARFDEIYDADTREVDKLVNTVSKNLVEADGGGMTGLATGNVPLHFGGLFGRSSLTVDLTSTAATAPPQNVEIVLALDNTTSMFRSNRFNLMRAAAKGFVNDLYDATETPGQTSIGIVPWATLVNINSERPGRFDNSAAANRNPRADGSRQVPNRPFQDRFRNLLSPQKGTAYTREALAQDFAPVSWRGCVRSAPGERLVSAGGTVTRALTDAPVRNMRWPVARLAPELRTFDAASGFVDPIDAQTVSFAIDPGQILACEQRPHNGAGNIHLDVDRACANRNGSRNIRLAEACVSDPNEFNYFRQGGDACPWQRNIFPWTRIRSISGPNQNCPVAMLGLSQDRGQIIDKLDEMHPVTGGTHMDIGLSWGLRMLSPRGEWSRFFGHSAPSAYTDTGTRKILILLTDGQNEAPFNFEGYYGCNEAGADDRGAAGPCARASGVRSLTDNSLDALTADSCTAIRNTYNIEIFTIAVDINDGASLQLLAACADDPDRAFNIRASQLDAVFEGIAAQELRLTQ